jgi:Flp pilus assembly protein TadB
MPAFTPLATLATSTPPPAPDVVVITHNKVPGWQYLLVTILVGGATIYFSTLVQFNALAVTAVVIAGLVLLVWLLNKLRSTTAKTFTRSMPRGLDRFTRRDQHKTE